MNVDGTFSPVVTREDNKECLPHACPTCKKGFDKIIPKLLPCLHSFCQPCLEDKLNEQREPQQTSGCGNESTSHGSTPSRLKCPKCGQEFLVSNHGISSLIDNQFILEAVSKPSGEGDTELHLCTCCEDNSSSTSYCLNCTEWLCDACVQAHQRVRVTKDHEIKSREELKVSLQDRGRTERSLYCQKHPSEKLKLFCANCERLTCRDCQLLEHKDHKYQFVSEAAIRYRDFFRKRLSILGEKIGPLAESIEAVQNSSKHLDHKADVVASEIKNSSLDIIKAVKQRENVLLTELKALVHFKRKMLTKQSKDLHLMQEILTHNYEFAKHAVMYGSDASLLYSKRQLGSRIQNLLSLKYRVTPVAHGDLKFVTEAVKLCNLILKAGSVMTPSTQRASVSPGAGVSHRNSNTIPQPQNGSNSNPVQLKVSPLHSLNAFNNRQIAGILSGSSMVTNTSLKPSSKVYPNVVTPQMSLSGMTNGMCSSSGPFLNSNAILNQQMHGVPKSVNSTTSPVVTRVSSTNAFYPTIVKVSGASTMGIPPQPDGSAIPLHHMDNSGKSPQTKSPPRYEKTAGNLKISSTSSSPGILESTSSQTSPQGNVFAKTSRDVRKDSSLTGPGVDPPTVVPSSPKTTQVSPKLQLSPSPLSPNLSKHSPNPSHSPSHASPKPHASPRSSQVPCSPIPTPTPTVPEPEEASSVGVKVKVEKDISPPERTCSKVKKEPKCYNSCGLASETSYPAASTFGPPSNNSSNDDWCAVCHNGGELLCCDACPKVFHLQCHVPSLTATPSLSGKGMAHFSYCQGNCEEQVLHVDKCNESNLDTWICGLCENLDNVAGKTSDSTSGAHKRRAPIGGMSGRETKVCEKMLLELFCHPDSLPFHEKVSKAVPNYYKIIQRPMDLTSIKTKLQPMHFEHYNCINEFISDCKLIFSNCALFNDADSEVGKMGKRLAVDFEGIVHKYLPQYEENNDEPKVKRRKEDIL